MPDFPSDPITPKEFIESFVPELFSAAELPPAAAEVDLKLGVRLDGADGGEWVIHLRAGGLEVTAGSRHEAAFTIIQTVEDWTGALWSGRGGVFGEAAAGVFRQGGITGAGGSTPLPGGAPSPEALTQLAALNGTIQVVVTGGEGGDWATGFKIGPGEIPEEPTTKITVADEDARAMQAGELDAMQAFMGGKIVVAGDMALMMQMQAIAMQAAAKAQSGS